MRKGIIIFTVAVLSVFTLNAQVAEIVWNYNFPVEDTVLNQLGSIRALTYDDDLLGDGVSAFAITNYADNGRIHVFKTIGDNALELVWTSPAPDTLGGNSTPRHIAFGDMDGDGRKEVIFQSSYNGIFIYEWDGVAGSYNFGTKPSQQITIPVIAHSTIAGQQEYCEYIEVMDYDKDGKQELTIAYNSTPNTKDNYYVISAIGGWSTDSPGFSGFTIEFILRRENPFSTVNYGLDGGPFAMIGADLDGDLDKDIILTNWNLKNVVPITTVQPDSFAKPDSVIGKVHYYLTNPDDDVALFGGMAADVDADGREEVYLTTYGANYNLVHMIHYEPGQSTYEIDSTNVFAIDLAPNITSPPQYPASLGYGVGDIDGDLKPNLYFTSIVGLGETVISAEYQGGDKTNPDAWLVETLYEGDESVISKILIEIDVDGVEDTLEITKNSPFASKIYARYTDFDKDGFEDILLPFQVVNDSVTVGIKRWTSASSYVIEEKKELNPTRNSIRILENSLSGIKAKDLTIITPDDYILSQNYPNPFNPETNIEFILPVRKMISLTVYNALGQKVKSLISDQHYDAGMYKMTWDGTNEAGERVASGVYIYMLKYGNFSKSKRMTLLK